MKFENHFHSKTMENLEENTKSEWKFLISEIPKNSLLLDCREEQFYKEKTIKGAYSAALIRKPTGSSDKSLLKLSSFLKSIEDLSENYENIIVFDEGLGMFAGKLAFLLKQILEKNKKIYIYNKLFDEIPESELEPGKIVISETKIQKPYQFKDIVSISYVQINLIKVQLIDVRTKDEYEGLIPRFNNSEPGEICGRIPGSIHFDWLELYDETGYLLPKQTVLKKLKKANLILERPTILYDYNGARACFMALVLKESKYKDVKVYLGSWLEWRKTQLPKQNLNVWYPSN
ncbi:MAG: sulfurtransferase [Leptospiraceae bacterium]|nr:sulfurtransferase [Leptospiraceae bacterium]MDW7975308.1 sulfurtransferase [Leptospiraceae bacterium]